MKVRIQKQTKTDDFFKAIGVSPKRKDEIFALVEKAHKGNDTKSGTLQAIADGVNNYTELALGAYWLGKQNATQDAAMEVVKSLFSGATKREVFSATWDAILTFVIFAVWVSAIVDLVTGKGNWFDWVLLVLEPIFIYFTLKRQEIL